MKKIISIFMSLTLFLSQSRGVIFAMHPEDPVAGNIEEFDLARQNFELNDIPEGGLCGKEYYSDGTIIEYVPYNHVEDAIKRYTDEYKEYHSDMENKYSQNHLSSKQKYAHLVAGTCCLAIGGLVSAYMGHQASKSTSKIDEFLMATGAAVQFAFAAACSYYSGFGPVHKNAKYRKSLIKAEGMDAFPAYYIRDNGERSSKGIAIIKMPEKTAKLISEKYYSEFEHFRKNDYEKNYCKLPCSKNIYAIFEQTPVITYDDFKYNSKKRVFIEYKPFYSSEAKRYEFLKDNLYYFLRCLNKEGIKCIKTQNYDYDLEYEY